MTRSVRGLAVIGMLSWPASAFAQTDKYSVTPEEHAACDADVYKLCSSSQNEDEVLVCMRAHKAELTPTCRKAFTTGLKRRNLPI